jgi:carboxymethylenebutenolidase
MIVSQHVSQGLLAYPERAALPLPSVPVLQEAWGLDTHIEDVVRRFAAAGYVAFGPDLYAVEGARPEPLSRERLAETQAFMNTQPPSVFLDATARTAALTTVEAEKSERLKGTFDALLANFGKPVFLDNVIAAARWLREECPQSRGQKVGVVGFCMGGGYSALLACSDPQLAGAVIFYGAAPPPEKVAGISCPVLGLYGALDARINAGIPGFREAMEKHGKSFETRIYENAAHGFFNDNRPSYHAGAARDAFSRTLAFFLRTLS